jgi:hypothetical protein
MYRLAFESELHIVPHLFPPLTSAGCCEPAHRGLPPHSPAASILIYNVLSSPLLLDIPTVSTTVVLDSIIHLSGHILHHPLLW